ncbi:site-specific recombinase XerD [Mucilaginibacter yixingensis]|uniref:Site-specific recombinase XerD n=1 Tax=Mucilaginibacter yixingensis TaxID=1295612 RepID=A0A2T5J5V3_9SPHI|nr:site-specific integrase [Mucilaginibacter yixingensis]PTQ93645.1 site-specific recombinase XerD [Mucilaginibacter yixingensis]
MLENSFGLLFFLKKPRNYERGPMYVYLRITVDGVPKEMSAKRNWEPSRWDAKKNRALGTKEDARALNEYLDILQNKVYAAKKDLVEQGKVITSLQLIDILSGNEQRKRGLMALFKKHNDDMEKMIGKGVAKGTWTNFNTSYKHTTAYLRSQYQMDEINILALDLEFIKGLYHWYRTIKNLGHNSALKNIANMKKIVISCVDNAWLRSDPFVKFDETREEVDTTFLIKEEIQAIAEKEIPNERLSRVRDVFIFCCFTGLAFADVKKLKKSEVSIGVDGELRVYKGRQKTGTPSLIPLLPITKTILKKYKGDPECIAKDQMLPVLSNQKYNSYLKEIATICGIQKDLKTHVARHTFGTTVTLANKVPLESIKDMMGHKSMRQTLHYAKITGMKINEDMAELKKRLTKTKFISDEQIAGKKN